MSYETTIDVRTDDMGGGGHVNNSKFVAYTDLARDRYLEDVHGYGPAALDHLVVHLEIDYEQALTTFDPVTVAIDVDAVGETSFTLEYEIRNGDNDVVATLSTVAVVVDEDGPTPLPEPLREGLTARLETPSV